MKARKKLKPRVLGTAVVAAAALLSASAANAVTVTAWGIHDVLEHGGQGTFDPPIPPGAFEDIYEFTLPSLSASASVAVANNLTLASFDITHISSGKVELFKGIFGDATPDTSLGSYSFDGSTGSTIHAVLGLLGGSYYYDVTGVADGIKGGLYTFTSTVLTAPVPEPETYGMLLAGLGIMGVVARRRTKKS